MLILRCWLGSIRADGEGGTDGERERRTEREAPAWSRQIDVYLRRVRRKPTRKQVLCAPSVHYVAPSSLPYKVLAGEYLYTCISQICISWCTRHKPTYYCTRTTTAKASSYHPPSCTHHPAPTATPHHHKNLSASTAAKSLSQLSVSALCVRVVRWWWLFSSAIRPLKSVPAPVRPVPLVRTGTCRPSLPPTPGSGRLRCALWAVPRAAVTSPIG